MVLPVKISITQLKEYLNSLEILIEPNWNNVKIITNNEKHIKERLFTITKN